MDKMIDCFKHFYTTCHSPMDGMYSVHEIGPSEELLDKLL